MGVFTYQNSRDFKVKLRVFLLLFIAFSALGFWGLYEVQMGVAELPDLYKSYLRKLWALMASVKLNIAKLG